MFTCVVLGIVFYGDKLIRSQLHVSGYCPPRCTLLRWTLQKLGNCTVDNVDLNFLRKLPFPWDGKLGQPLLWETDKLSFVKTSVNFYISYSKMFWEISDLVKMAH